MFLPNVAIEETGIAQVANINQFPRRDGDEHLILRVELSILVGEKSLHLGAGTYNLHYDTYPVLPHNGYLRLASLPLIFKFILKKTVLQLNIVDVCTCTCTTDTNVHVHVLLILMYLYMYY